MKFLGVFEVIFLLLGFGKNAKYVRRKSSHSGIEHETSTFDGCLLRISTTLKKSSRTSIELTPSRQSEFANE